LTVYAIVNTVTAKPSSVERVQILIDGKQADTLSRTRRICAPFEARHVARQETKGTQ